MIVLCFVSGVICYQLFQIDQVMQIIEWGDRRLLTMDRPLFIWNFVPFIAALGIVLFFSTHHYLTMIAPIMIALKCTFLGFSSVFLLVHHESVKLYALWWFPFQLMYCVLLIMLFVSTRQKRTGRTIKNQPITSKIMFFSLVMVIFFGLENFVISYLFK